MNYAQARELDDKSGWHFTIRRGSKIRAHPCCMELNEMDEFGKMMHAPHATKEEAEACFNTWRRKPEHVEMDGSFNDWTGCVICDAPTKKAARILDSGWPHYVALCDKHLTVEDAISTIKDISSMAYS